MQAPTAPTTRQVNLKRPIAQWGGGETLAKKLGYANSSYLSHMATGHRPITEKTARKIESTLGLPVGWMDQDHDGRSAKDIPPVHVNTALFAQVVEAVTSAMGELGVELGLEKFEEVVTLAYEDAIERKSVDMSLLRRMLKLAR